MPKTVNSTVSTSPALPSGKSPGAFDGSLERWSCEWPDRQSGVFCLRCDGELGEQRDAGPTGNHLRERRQARGPELELVRFAVEQKASTCSRKQWPSSRRSTLAPFGCEAVAGDAFDPSGCPIGVARTRVGAPIVRSQGLIPDADGS